MARPRNPNSPWSKYGIGKNLEPHELQYMEKYLERKKVSFNYLICYLIRQWVKGVDLKKLKGGITLDEA